MQDVGGDASGDSIGFDTSIDTPPSDTTGDGIATDSGPGDATPETPIDSNTDGGSCGGDAACGGGLTCCADACRNTHNDLHNCGGCGTECSGATPMCLAGKCSAAVCSPTCGTGTICCEIDGPGPTHFQCIKGNECPICCPLCK